MTDCARLKAALVAVYALGALLNFGCAAPPARSGRAPSGSSPPASASPYPSVTIMQLQGDGPRSPWRGKTVTTEGVVTLFSSGGTNFWMQDPQGDGDPSTSDGVYVAGGGFPKEGSRPRVGDLVRLSATVDEQQFGNALPLTRLRKVRRLEVLSRGRPLPEPVEIGALPDESIPAAIAFWEPLEGMRVVLPDARVVGPTSRFGEFAVLSAQNAQPGSGFFPASGHLVLRPLGPGQVDYNPERILVDDASLETPLQVRVGDRLKSLSGVVHYSFGNYKLEPDRWELEAQEPPPLPGPPSSAPEGEVSVATFNLENLFDPLDDPAKADEDSTPTEAELETKLSKLALAIELELRLPAILAVQEVENVTILRVLAERVNAAAGTDYRATSLGSSDRRGIEVGFLWDAKRVTLERAFQPSGPAVERAFGRLSPSPGREPLVGVFRVDGRVLTVVNNHFKSKGGDDPLFGVAWPPLRPSERQRKAQARVVRDFLDELFQGDPQALVLVSGDLNDFPFPEPGEGQEHPLGVLVGEADEVPLSDLGQRVAAAERFTYLYEGNAQVLDYLLAGPALGELLLEVKALHFDADFPQALGRDPGTPWRASDHDPLLARFRF